MKCWLLTRLLKCSSLPRGCSKTRWIFVKAILKSSTYHILRIYKIRFLYGQRRKMLFFSRMINLAFRLSHCVFNFSTNWARFTVAYTCFSRHYIILETIDGKLPLLQMVMVFIHVAFKILKSLVWYKSYLNAIKTWKTRKSTVFTNSYCFYVIKPCQMLQFYEMTLFWTLHYRQLQRQQTHLTKINNAIWFKRAEQRLCQIRAS